MNTTEVAKLLGVSPSTIKRWVKQLELPMDRNERGHYQFNDEAIEYLKFIQDQINRGILLHEIPPLTDRTSRKGIVKQQEKDPHLEKLISKIDHLEKRLDGKADSVTSYQLLQHRHEIEDLQNLVTSLSTQLQELELELNSLRQNSPNDLPLVLDLPRKMTKAKRKNFFSTLFGF